MTGEGGPHSGPLRMPFPVAPEYRVRADIARLEGPHTIRDAQAQVYADAKRELIERFPDRHRAIAPDADVDGVHQALVRFADITTSEQPQVAANLRAVARFLDPKALAEASRDAVWSVADRLAMSLQEDFVIMRSGSGAELLHVCFPSHWDPGAHAGSPLSTLHGPVPHGERLQAASDNLLEAMITKGPFERWVWSVNASGSLAQHPAEPRPELAPGPLLGQLWFRVERQTTIPMPDLRRSVFTIRIFQAPLESVLRVDSERAARLAAAVGSMDPALRRYKGMGEMGDRLVAELAEFG